MVTVKARSDQKEKLAYVLTKIYNVASSKYKQHADGDDNIVVEIDDSGIDYNTDPYITFEQSNALAFISFYPALGAGNPITESELFAAIKDDGIKFGLDKDAVKQAYLQYKRGFVVEHCLIATGVPANPGKDASITLQFSSGNKRPKITPDGKIDHKNQGRIIQAKKGEVLIIKRPATSGAKGMDVRNKEIPPQPGHDVALVAGEGVGVNPLGTQYLAMCDGYVEFSENLIEVHEVYLVPRDVDYSTGNIKFEGTVHVKGDVLAGFKIEASKDVIVDGICSDCEIIAHGNITVNTGIKGNEKNVFMAKDDITIGYAEKARIYAKHDIIIKKYAYNCDLGAGNAITAVTSEGIIAGGTVRVFQDLTAKQLGTMGNTKFHIYMGTKYYADQAMDKLKRQKIQLNETLKQIADILKKFPTYKPEVANNPKVKRLQDIQRSFESLITEMTEREEEFKNEARANQPKIKVTGRVHDGVTTTFFNEFSSTLRERMDNVVFYVDEKYREVAWVSLKDAKSELNE